MIRTLLRIEASIQRRYFSIHCSLYNKRQFLKLIQGLEKQKTQLTKDLWIATDEAKHKQALQDYASDRQASSGSEIERKSTAPDVTGAAPTQPTRQQQRLSFPPVEPQPQSGIQSASDSSNEAKTPHSRVFLGRRKWTAQEDELLLRLAETTRKFPSSGPILWRKVKEHFESRTEKGCRDRYTKLMEQKSEDASQTTLDGMDDNCFGKTAGRIPEEEKLMLMELVRKYGERNWTVVSKEMEKIMGVKRSKGVWLNLWNLSVCPKARNAPKWTKDRYTRLAELMKLHGRDEIYLAFKFFPEYTPLLIKRKINKLLAGQKKGERKSKSAVRLEKSTAVGGNDAGIEVDDSAKAKANGNKRATGDR